MANSNSETGSAAPPKSLQSLVVVQFGGKLAALPLESVAKVVPMADLARPPGLAIPLEGILNLAGAPVPVLRLDRLLHAPERRPGLYSALVVLKGDRESQVALLVDKVSEILHVSNNDLLPVGEQDSFNGCVTATVTVAGNAIHLLSPPRILLAKERESLAAFRTLESVRLAEWKLSLQ